MELDKNLRLIWIDLEMTGLRPNEDKIIEIAMLVTEADLSVVAQSPVIAIHQSLSCLQKMDEWNQRTHTRSGLIERVKNSDCDEVKAEQQMLDFLQQHVAKGVSPMCGNSICQDRRFLANYMPTLEAWFHYRNLDVSTIKELIRRWRPDLLGGFAKREKHEALADILESIEELAYYRQHFLKMPES